MRHITFRARVFLLFFALFLLVTMAMTLYVTYTMERQYTMERSDRYETLYLNTIALMDNELFQLQQKIDSLTEQPWVKSLMARQNAAAIANDAAFSPYALYEYTQSLLTYPQQSHMITHFGILFHRVEMAVTSSGRFTLDAFFDTAFVINGIPRAELIASLNAFRHNDVLADQWVLIGGVKRRGLIYTHSLPPDPASMPRATALAFIPYHSLNALLEPLSEIDRASLAILGEDGAELLSMGDPLTISAAEDWISDEDISRYESDGYFHYLMRSNYMPWTFRLSIPKENFLQGNTSIGVTRLWLTVLALVSSALLAQLLSTVSYRPIQKTIEDVSAIMGNTGPDRGMDEFVWFKQMVDSIQQQIDTLKSHSELHRPTLVQSYLGELIRGTDGAKALTTLHMLGIELNLPIYAIIYVKNGRREEHHSARSTVTKLFDPLSLHLYVIEEEENIALLINCVSGAVYSSVVSRVAHLFLVDRTPQGAFIGLGEPVSDPKKLADQYRETREACEYAHAFGLHFPPMTIEALRKSTVFVVVPEALINALVSHLMLRDREQALEAVHAIADLYLPERHPNLAIAALRELGHTYSRAFDVDSLYAQVDEDVIHRLLEGTLLEIREAACEILEVALRRPAESNQKSFDEQLRAYIEAHLGDESLSLKSAADHFHYSHQYFSSLCKEALGRNFLEYVNHSRIDLACTLLKQTDEDITSIMHAAGIQSAATFRRLFNKQMGVSPSEYRRARRG